MTATLTPRVVHINFTESRGGAAIAAKRLHNGLLAANVDSHMLVYKKDTSDARVHPIRLSRFERGLRRATIYNERPSRREYPAFNGAQWSAARVSTPVQRHLEALSPQLASQLATQVVHLHWIGDGLLSVPAVKQLGHYPMVWTLHDMWMFTGGCHYSDGCTRFHECCGQCPMLGSTQEHDLSRKTWQAKQRGWQNLPISLVAPSNWLAEQVRSSGLMGHFGGQMRVQVIPNGLDLSRFRPYDQRFARDVLGLPHEKSLILFGAQHMNDPRKGFHHLQTALRLLHDQGSDVEVVTFGDGATSLEISGLRTHTLGSINDERVLALAYAAANAFVLPSTEDNLPNTVMEALACGLPPIAFNVGGLPDMITHKQDGYLARAFDAQDLANGITWTLEDRERHARLRVEARNSAEIKYDLTQIAAQYRALYADVLSHG